MRYLPAVLALLILAGCTTIRREEPAPETQFGHREEVSDDGRVTTVIAPADGSQVYRFRDASIEEVTVRPAPPSLQATPVEVLVKGAFPDSCTELHEAVQSRTAAIVSVKLTTRRPQGALCAAVIRPFRFYLLLEGSYEPGPYTLRLNGEAYPFEIRSPQTQGQ